MCDLGGQAGGWCVETHLEAIEKRSKIPSSATLEAAGMSCRCQGSREAGAHHHTPALP